MRNQAGLLAIVALLVGCGSSDEATPVPQPNESATPSPALPSPAKPEPDLAACPKAQPFDDSLRGRDGPVAAPPMMDGMVKSDMDHFAILTLSGKTVCIDTNWIEQVSGARLTRDNRFLSFEWTGYEAFGFMVVDRSGAGTVIETGTTPLASPSGKRLASVDLSVSGFGGLNAFAVWQIEPVGVRQLAKVEDDLPPGDWTIKGWSGETCVNLAFLPIERHPSSASEMDSAPRDPWNAAQARGWKPAPGSCPAA